MFLAWIFMMLLLFFLPASLFVFGLSKSITYAIKGEASKSRKFSWVSTLGFLACLIIFAFYTTS